MARVYTFRPYKGSPKISQVNWWRRKRGKQKKHGARTQSNHKDDTKPARSLQDLPYEILQYIVVKLPALALSDLKLALPWVLHPAREHQFKHLVCRLPSIETSDMIGNFTSPSKDFAISTLKTGKDSLRRAVAVLQDPDVAKYVRSVHVCRVGEGRAVPAHYQVPREILENFASLLTYAQRVTQIWIALPTDTIPGRILACYPSLITLRVNTATTSQLQGLRIERLTIDHYQLDNNEAPLPPETHPILPWLPELTHLCIHADNYFKAAPFCLLDGKQLPNLTHLSLKGTFGEFYLSGSWSQLRSLTVIGRFLSLRWIAQLAPYIQQLSMSVRRWNFLPFDDDDILGIEFDHLEVLELHWCNLKKFPNGARMRRLTHYLESREIRRHSGELNLLRNIDLHLEKLRLLAIRAQYGMDDSGETETLTIDQTYCKLRETRKQQGYLSCFVQAPVEAPTTKDSWLRHASAPVLWYNHHAHSDNLEKWQSERLELLRRADLQSKFAETRGEDFRQPFAPHPLGFVVPFGINSERSFEND